MYENNNTVSIDWKGLFIKLIIVAVIIFAIFKGYEYFSDKKGNTQTTTTTATQLFNANLESLRQAGENYYDYSNYPSEGQTVMVTLGELVTKGDLKELYDENGNECSRENSYVALTNDGGQYKLKATLSCGETSNYTVVMIGCECEGDECAQAIKKLENETSKSEDKVNSSSSNNNGSSSKKDDSSSKKDNVKPSKNTKEEKETTTKKPTQVIDMSDINNDNDKPKKTTTRPKTTDYTKKTYKVKFDSNGGDDIESQYVERNETAYEPANPERDNDRFVGWYYNGKKWDFDNEITKNITLEAYYWATKDDVETTVYSAAYDTLGSTFVTVEHQLAIPEEISGAKFKNQRIKSISSRNARSMRQYSNDLYYHRLYHTSTYAGYDYYNNGINSTTDGSTLGTLYNINVKKSNTYDKYDTWVRWSAYVYNQCPNTFDGYNCNYGIVYKVTWEYDELTD